ncbi:MAG: type VI secretion system-associated FHA domain protein TagH [Pseudomonas sp.]|uniref:type VI secretion system-associated FHA domain protein TagH n=1 Tax=Pseudomonas sp. TaxID=306 RepID=UPI00391CD559
MQLVFEVCHTGSGEAPARKLFDGVGGVIGRAADCDWVILDPSRLLSSLHALVSYRDGCYFLTDISSNGIGVSGSKELLSKGQARLINEGDVYRLGAVDIRARLTEQSISHERQADVRNEIIPDDAFLALEPLRGLEYELPEASDALEHCATVPGRLLSHGAVDQDHLIVPSWAEPDGAETSIAPQAVASRIHEPFWSQFGTALGLDMEPLDRAGREALAIKMARLFRQTIEGLQQSLRTRDELNSELNLGWPTPASTSRNPLKDCPDGQAAVASLLCAGDSGALSAELAVAQVCRELQVHQLALVVACRAAVRSTLAGFAPGHLQACFERDDRPLGFSTDGAHWRAYQRHYRRLIDEQVMGEPLSRHDFSKAYEEQVRLVGALHAV